MQKNNSKTKVFVGMSGGVDSSVSAALLKEQGYDVTGVYMKNWSGDDFGIQADCPWEEDMKDVQNVCKVLDIPFKSYNFEKEYRKDVVEYFFNEYKAGRTPNPDVMCNREIKFKRFLEKAVSEGADFIATGHYARVVEENGIYKLLKGVDNKKDQSYFLYTLSQEQLCKVIFPIGGMHKSEVRKLAEKFSLPNAAKPDSQGICFIGEIDVQEFLRKTITTKEGNIVDIDTKEIIGKHDGVYYYTIGQREGLRIGGTGVPYFVVGKNIETNELFVAKGKKNPVLFKREVKLEYVHFISGSLPFSKGEIKRDCEVSIRYRHKPAEADLTIVNDEITIEFKEPQRAVASGQSAVIYDGEECLGGGVIR